MDVVVRWESNITGIRHVVVDRFPGVAFAKRNSFGVTLHSLLDHILQRLILRSKHTNTHTVVSQNKHSQVPSSHRLPLLTRCDLLPDGRLWVAATTVTLDYFLVLCLHSCCIIVTR